MFNKRYTIGVRDHIYPENFKLIKRVIRAKQIGNFNPFFCIYNKRERLVCSHLGDLSDPFRRTEEYLEHLYIMV